MRLLSVLILSIAVCFAVVGCAENGPADCGETIAVTTSWLECALRDVYGGELDIVSLIPPGGCPGHFDISPGAIGRLRNCDILFCFDFQDFLRERLAGISGDSQLNMANISVPGGLCLPSSYLNACIAIGEILSEHYPDRADHFAKRLSAIRNRMAELSGRARSSFADLSPGQAAILCSEHQAEFCKFLGFSPVTTFGESDGQSAALLNGLLARTADSDIRLVVANLQAGTQLAESLAGRFGVPLVVLSNFPDAAFDRMVLANAAKLADAMR